MEGTGRCEQQQGDHLKKSLGDYSNGSKRLGLSELRMSSAAYRIFLFGEILLPIMFIIIIISQNHELENLHGNKGLISPGNNEGIHV